MTKTILVIALFWTMYFSFGQECTFEVNLQKNGLKIDYKEVTEREFLQGKKITRQDVSIDSIPESDLFRKYPTLFSKVDSCFIFKGEEERQLCKRLTQDRFYTNYRVLGTALGKLILEHTEYEDWGHWIIDLKTRKIFTPGGFPILQNENEFVANTNYYGQDHITLASFKSGKYALITIEDWETRELRKDQNSYYFKLKEYNSYCKPLEYKFLKITPQ